MVSILGSITFEISRVLESLFDAIEYHEAKHASAKKAKKKRRRESEQAKAKGKRLLATD